MKQFIKYFLIIIIAFGSVSFNISNVDKDISILQNYRDLFDTSEVLCGIEEIPKGVTYIRNEAMEKAGKCYGYVNCSACSTCGYCAHCNRDGGSCGVCGKRSSRSQSYNKNKSYSGSSSKPTKTQVAIDYNTSRYTYQDRVTIEQLLDKLGYSVGVIDGNFTNMTISAIKNFQRDNNLTQDGKIGPTTLKYLVSKFK